MKTAQSAFDREVMAYADGMGISLFEKLVRKNQISFIQVTKSEVQFFGFQLIEYLIAQTKNNQIVLENADSVASPAINRHQQEDRIIRFPEVQKMVGLSRTTIWRLERTDKFPKRVAITDTLVGWHLNEIKQWQKERNQT